MLCGMPLPALLVALIATSSPTLTVLERAKVRVELGKVDASCTRVPPSFPGVKVVGSFANDRGCIDEGYVHHGGVIRSVDHASPVLEKRFRGKDVDAKKNAALAWAREVLFQNRALSTAPERGFGGAGQPMFAPASAEVAGDGILVELWVQEPAGMVAEQVYSRYRVTFSAKGDVTKTQLIASQRVPIR